MVIIELAEDDAPEYEQQKPKKNPKPASPITQEAASLRTLDSSPAEGKDPTVQPSPRDAQPQSEESLTETSAQGAQPAGRPDETLMRTRTGKFFP